jgi:hypothetical protein
MKRLPVLIPIASLDRAVRLQASRAVPFGIQLSIDAGERALQQIICVQTAEFVCGSGITAFSFDGFCFVPGQSVLRLVNGSTASKNSEIHSCLTKVLLELKTNTG